MTRVIRDPFRGQKVKGQSEQRDRKLVCFTGTLMSNGRLVYYNLQAENSGWLFKSPLQRARYIDNIYSP